MQEELQLQVTGLVKAFGEETVLNGIDLSVHKGEVVVVLGPSGCGKSTLLRCLNGLEAINGGQILLDGEEITAGGKKYDAHPAEDRHGVSKLRSFSA